MGQRVQTICVCIVLVGSATTAIAADPAPPAGALVRADGWFAPRQPTHPAPELPETITRAYIIPVKGGIRPALADAIRRKVAFCKGQGAELVIFEIDTPGGDSESMGRISDYIAREFPKAHTVAFVNPNALSAGAVISLACDEIIVSELSKIGGATPIMVSPRGELVPMQPAERAKFESNARADARRLARRKGHNQALAQAMITMGVEVWLIRNHRTGEIKLVDPDKNDWGRNVRNPPKGEGKRDSDWRYLRLIDDDDELVMLTGDEAVELGLADAMVTDRQELLKRFNLAGAPIEMEDTRGEILVAFLTSPAVTGLLLALGALGIYMEFRTPGFGLPGVLGALCLALALGGRYMGGLAQWWELLLLAAGVVLIVLEVTVIPGFGIAGIAGILCLLMGLIGVIVSNAPDRLPIPMTPMDWSYFHSGLLAMSVAVVLSLIGAIVLSKYLPKIPIASRLILAPATEYTGETASPLDRIAAGDIGVVESDCRPVGKVRFDEELLDGVTEGDMILAGAKVRVLRRAGNRVVIERVSET
ncbi:hypothetical protein LCGC14_0017550 [marine sediment metagenome]|uniref:Uncharacterized protein n=1 Tax=marine sediment metagenome TaxID=412755 RepID=A0A0F9YGE0_9ZZZZ|nr:hypothetical protein [Phycisphaerae bacterium]